MNRLRLIATPRDSQDYSEPKVVSILSGKGGVGKTVLACNLAEQTASCGYRTLLVDADFSFGNVHILTNTAGEYGLGRFTSGQLSLAQATTEIAERLDILPSESNDDTKVLYDVKMAAAMMKKLRQQAADYDLVLIDHGSGKSDAADVIADASNLNILVVVPELTSLADGYGLFKHLIQTYSAIDCCLLINRAESPSDAEHVYGKFAALTEQFLRRVPPLLGYLLEDPSVKESVSSQRLMARDYSDSVAAQSLVNISQSLFQGLLLSTDRSRVRDKKAINHNQALADKRE